ncbi:hypothetical protein ACN06F_10345 [Vreelandella sp. 21]|uniref:hypothetical protein n=1 Tax=Vreelandella sp. 21 TaxID=3402864 RepID=UPI003D9A32EA
MNHVTLGRNELADYVQDEGLKKKRDCAEWWVTEPKRTCWEIQQGAKFGNAA